jgi:serine protease
MIPILLPLFGLACDTAANGVSSTPMLLDTEAYVERELLVAVDDRGDGVEAMEVRKAFGLTEVETLDGIGVTRVLVPEDQRVKDVASLLGGDHRVDFAEPNYIVRANARSSDPYADLQWNLDLVNAWEAWEYTDGTGSIVAVLDTGVSEGTDGFAQLLNGYDTYYGDNDPSDRDGHGTFVAGTIAQATNNGVGVAGMAPGAAILPVKVLSDNGYGDVRALANGIVYATDSGADVINMSLGSPYSSSTEKRAIEYAYAAGVVLVAATGNEFANQVGYPAAYPEVIAVGASRVDGSRAPYSNTGTGIELMAPGGDLSKDWNNDGYADGVLQETVSGRGFTYTFWEGTSMATPHVAAAAAMLKSAGVDDPEEIREILANTAVDVGAAGYDTSTGYGVIDAEAALAWVYGDSGDSGQTETPAPEEEEETAPPRDTTAPTISGVDGYTSRSGFTVMWTTDEPADTYVEFEGYGQYGDDALTTAHTLSFTAGSGTYVFKMVSTDAAGNTAETDWYQIRM